MTTQPTQTTTHSIDSVVAELKSKLTEAEYTFEPNEVRYDEKRGILHYVGKIETKKPYDLHQEDEATYAILESLGIKILASASTNKYEQYIPEAIGTIPGWGDIAIARNFDPHGKYIELHIFENVNLKVTADTRLARLEGLDLVPVSQVTVYKFKNQTE